MQFYLKGKESGFAFNEVNLLRQVAVESRIKEPTSLFWSIRQLDRCIKSMVINFRAKNIEGNVESVNVLSKLYEFRRKVEFDQPKYNLGIKSSREITKRQRVRISLPDLGPFGATVVDNLRRYLAISYPQGPKLPEGFTWKGQQLGISFWRDGDAGYFFQSKVIGDYAQEKSYPILHIGHNEKVIRTQKRRSVRAEVQTAGQLYPLRSVEDASEDLETQRGLKCIILDISEDGAALLIGGRAKVGLPIKFQFALSENTIAMSGIVKGVNFDQRKNRSVLHLQSLPLSNRTKNVIRAFVYDLFGEQRREKADTKKAVQN